MRSMQVCILMSCATAAEHYVIHYLIGTYLASVILSIFTRQYYSVLPRYHVNIEICIYYINYMLGYEQDDCFILYEHRQVINIHTPLTINT